MRREKGSYTREKNLLFLKNVVQMGKEGHFTLKKEALAKFHIDELKFSDIFAGPEPKFDESKGKSGKSHHHSSSSSSHKSKKAEKPHKAGSKKAAGKGQGTLDSWVKGDKPTATQSAEKPKVKKQSAAEIEAEMKRMKEQNARFKEEMRLRAEEAKKRKLEDKAKERERKKEEAKMVKELMNEWKKKRDDLECDDLKELPRPRAVRCKVPNQLFGDFLVLLEFVNSFSELLETKDSFPHGLTFDILEEALTDSEAMNGSLFDVLAFLLGALFDLQDEEDNEVKLDKITVNPDNIDKSVLGKDVDIANQIRSATHYAKWPFATQGGQKLRELHMDQYTITEILRLHLQAAGAFRSEKLIMWLYQQRGGYRLADDPGLQFRMEDPQILEALTRFTVFELSCQDKIKILNTLMYQILSFATVRDEVDEKYNEYFEAKSELREHKISENKRKRELEESEKQKRREEKGKKKEEELKKDETGNEDENKDKDKEEEKKKPTKKFDEPPALTERQRLAIQSQKDKEEQDRQRKEEIKRSEAWEKEQELLAKVMEYQHNAGMSLLGRDRAYRRFWTLESLPGLFVEHDDELVGPCMDTPTPYEGSTGPMDEETATKRVQEILNSRGKSPDEKSSSDKENDQEERKHKVGDANKTYSRNNSSAPSTPAMKQKVLSAKNGSMDISAAGSTALVTPKVEMNGTSTTTTEMSPESKAAAAKLPWGACLANDENCPVHSTILPRTHWAFYSTVEEVDGLIDSLNERGFREGELKERLLLERERLMKRLKKFEPVRVKLVRETEDKKEVKMEVDDGENEDEKKKSLTKIVELTLRDQILELEEKIFFGTLGTLKIRDRESWQKAIQEGSYDKQCDGLTWGGKSAQETPAASRLQSGAVSKENSRPGTPNGKFKIVL